MFSSFFPRPKVFFLSAIAWTIFAGILWFLLVEGWSTGLAFFAQMLGTNQPDSQASFLTPERLLIYSYVLACGASFGVFWSFDKSNHWKRWSVWAATGIVISTYFSVQISVYINDWYGNFYDLIQAALSKSKVVTIEEYYSSLISVTWILIVNISFQVLLDFIVQHFIFRWRTAMNNYYTTNWSKLRVVEGAAQRVQEDTMRFARQLEGLGIGLVSSFMTLVAFLPVLWILSKQVTTIPLIGEIDGSMVFVALLSASFGTILLALVGIRLPGLEFRNQRVEAAYRKELVYGEDFEERAQPATLQELFGAVRKNYFRLYFNYLYFGVAKWAYLQGANFVPIFALGPTVVAGAITLGVFTQINNAFDKVDGSFRFFAVAWSQIVEFISIYKRLRAFEAAIHDQPLPDIDQDFIARRGQQV